jgi:murein L,D-transpeptidase YcbB/YkuD
VKRSRSPRRVPVIPTLLALLVLGLILAPTEGCKATRRMAYNVFHHRKAKSKPNTTDYADNVEQVVNSPQLAIMKWSNFSDYQAQVQQFYDDRSYELAWTRDGALTNTTTQLISLFENAAQKGLNPDDYDASRWPQRVDRVAQIFKTKDTSDNAQDVIAQFDAAMTITTMRYLSDLHLGRVNPQDLNFDIDVPARRALFDLPTFVNDQLVDKENVPSIVATVEPQNAMYAATEKALGQYLVLAKQQAAQPAMPLPAVAKTVSVGGTYPAMPALLARLQMEGDAGAESPSATYSEEMAAAVKHFQARHGITPDGKLTTQTIAELNVPLSARVQQLDDALERWRWLPDNFVNPRVLVNLPEFIVRTYNADGSQAFKMKVVDGEAEGQHDTPIFVRTMRFVIFRPYWNLPTSIIKKELMKHIDSGGAGYLDSHGYEVTTRDGTVASGWTADDIEHGKYAVRQKPGPKNSLGLVKFMFPNEYDVYMHSTPEMNLFGLTRRDRSHGCIRLNDAEAMANWVLQGQGDWDADKIHDAMFGDDDNKQVNLKTPLAVSITYLTANADEDGSVHFFDDIYGYDQQLEQALAQGRPYDKSEHKINPKLTPGETE